MQKLFIATGIMMFGVAAISNASPFTNGGFESPGSPLSTTFLSNGSTFVTGWTHGGNDFGEFYTPSGSFGINAAAGSFYIGWGASGAINGTLSQTFDTVIGSTYTVNYLLTTQQLTGVLPIQSNLVEALDGATVLNSATNSFNQPAGVWNPGATLSFVAASTSTTLRFTDQTTAANSPPINWGLDEVTVAAVTDGQSAPEPATCALMALGLGVLGIWRKK